MHSLKYKLFWYTALIISLISLVYGIYAVTISYNYNWAWNRVPNSFIFNGGIAQYANADGDAKFGEVKDGNTTVTIKYVDGTEETFVLITHSLRIYNGDLISEGDILGDQHVVKTGLLIRGLIATLEISIFASILGLFLGLIFGLFKISSNPMLRWWAHIYIEIIRGTPLLVQLFITYFFIGTVINLDRFTAGILALGIFAGAYVAEIIRAGIQSIDPGQMEAARSLGMNYYKAMIYIVLPQAFKRILPALAGQFISLIKDSSLVSVIAITDLTKAGREIISGSFNVFEIWFTVAGLYFVLTFSLSIIVKHLERKLAASD